MYLNCHSYYSLRYGTLSPEDLVLAAKAQGIDSLALTDINNTSCAQAFIKACEEAGIKPVLGLEFRQDGKLLYIGLAKNKEGWGQLCKLLTDASLAGEALPELAPAMPDTYMIYPRLSKPLEDFADNEYLGIRPAQVNKLFSSPLRHRLDKLVALAPATFLDETGFRTHKLLRCIDLNLILGRLEPAQHARPDELLLSPAELEQAYLPYPELLTNARQLLENCRAELRSDPSNNRLCYGESPEADRVQLLELAQAGLVRRYGPGHAAAEARLEKEMRIIHQMDFTAYFLITWDIIEYAKEQGYFHVGRGSGANSIVAYCLGITDVDPLELDLYFERFINPHRSSPPDFDIDFSWSDRDDIFDYIFRKYGRRHTAMLATYNTFNRKSITRELGKVFGLPKTDIDTLVDEPDAHYKHHPLARYVFQYGKRLENFPNYLSIHAGGLLISQEPLHFHTALMQMPKGVPITHFDMYGAEDLGFHKYDVLSQRGLGHIKDAVDIIRDNKQVEIDIHQVDRIKEDPQVRQKLRSGNCIGCFYIESPAMRGLLNKLRCDDYRHLVAASSIIRPGVAQSGMMRQYISRFHNQDKIEYLHPIFKQHLSDTYGVMVYQEDVIKIVHHFAGLALDESDILRRIMSGKRRHSAQFEELKEKYFSNCRALEYKEDLIREVWRQVESFSGFSFCKAHSASFAVESFQSLYLKTYYPLEFMVAVINNFGGFYDTELYVHETRIQGGHVHPPCVNKSQYLTCIDGKDVYLGFKHLQQLEERFALDIIYQRELHGPFSSLENFVQRLQPDRKQLQILIRIGAFRFSGMNKYELMWDERSTLPPGKKSYSGYLFEQASSTFTLPQLEEGTYDQAYDEMELLGFPLCSPFSLVDHLPDLRLCTRHLPHRVGKKIQILAYYVTRKKVFTVNGKIMNFGTWLDQDGQFFDTTHFPEALQRYPLRGKGVYRITGLVIEDFGFPSIEVQEIEKLPYVKDARY